MTQYDQKALEQIGLLKMDFLGLANLTMLRSAVEYIKETRGIELDLSTCPLDDPRPSRCSPTARRRGVFQLEGSGMTPLRPRAEAARRIRHLAAMVALYRPARWRTSRTTSPRKDGRAASPPTRTRRSKPILEETYGIIVYQDQVLQIVQAIAGYSSARPTSCAAPWARRSPR